MKPVTDINILLLMMSFIILLLPIAFLLYYRIKLVSSIVVSVFRMVIQLSLVAVYLEWVFEKNSIWINSLWVFIMIWVGIFTTIRRASLSYRVFILPLFISGFSSILIVDAFFLGVILKLEYVFDAQYFIPITGMILGNALNHNIIGLRTYYKELAEKPDLYQFLLTNTANTQQAIRPFVAEAVKQALNPLIASMSVMGLISLPGMMTGQLLGGSAPGVAIKYQIMIMIAIFVGCSLNLFISILVTRKFAFDEYSNLKSPYVFSGK